MTKVQKDQKALLKVLDALDGADPGSIRRVLRAVAIFHEISIEEVRYIASTPIVVERPWRPYLQAPIWAVGQGTRYGGSTSGGEFTSGEARLEVTSQLLHAADQSAPQA